MDSSSAPYTRTELVDLFRRHASANHYYLNTDAVVASLVEAFIARKDKLGDYYCPCRRFTGQIEADQKIICPCAYHSAEIAQDGHCHCQLFLANPPVPASVEPVA